MSYVENIINMHVIQRPSVYSVYLDLGPRSQLFFLSHRLFAICASRSCVLCPSNCVIRCNEKKYTIVHTLYCHYCHLNRKSDRDSRDFFFTHVSAATEGEKKRVSSISSVQIFFVSSLITRVKIARAEISTTSVKRVELRLY